MKKHTCYLSLLIILFLNFSACNKSVTLMLNHSETNHKLLHEKKNETETKSEHTKHDHEGLDKKQLDTVFVNRNNKREKKEWIKHKGGTINYLAGPALELENLNPEYFVLKESYTVNNNDDNKFDVYQFAQISDMQLRHRGRDLTKIFLKEFIDKQIPTTRTNFFQDYADVFYFGFILKAIREEVEKNNNLDFVINTGDVMQMGWYDELDAYNNVISKFLLTGSNSAGDDWKKAWSNGWLTPKITVSGTERDPLFFNIIGNHDVFIMGNFDEHGPIRETDDSIYNLEQLKENLVRSLNQSDDGDEAVERIMGENKGEGATRDNKEDGYYSVDRPLSHQDKGEKVRLIMLNTNETNFLDPHRNLVSLVKYETTRQQGGMFPSISKKQYKWLINKLETAKNDDDIKVVLVFGHNQLGEISVNDETSGVLCRWFNSYCPNRDKRNEGIGKIARQLKKYKKVKGYFCGHLHPGSPAINWYHDMEFTKADFYKFGDETVFNKLFKRGIFKEQDLRADEDEEDEITTSETENTKYCFDYFINDKETLERRLDLWTSKFGNNRGLIIKKDPAADLLKEKAFKFWNNQITIKNEEHNFQEFIIPSIQEYPKAYAIFTILLDKQTKEFKKIKVDYHNIEDLLDLNDNLPHVRVYDRKPQEYYDLNEGDKDSIFDRHENLFLLWVKQLNDNIDGEDIDEKAKKRMRTLAKFAYYGSIEDLENNISVQVPIATDMFNPDLKDELRTTYFTTNDYFYKLKGTRWGMVDGYYKEDDTKKRWTVHRFMLEEWDAYNKLLLKQQNNQQEQMLFNLQNFLKETGK